MDTAKRHRLLLDGGPAKKRGREPTASGAEGKRSSKVGRGEISTVTELKT